MEEAQSLELKIQAAIEKARSWQKNFCQDFNTQAPVTYPNLPIVSQNSPNPASPPLPAQSSHSYQVEAGISQSSPTDCPANHSLKPSKVPSYGRGFWGLLETLVEQSKEPVNLKMVTLRPCLFGSALESIPKFGISEPQYKESKEILIAKSTLSGGNCGPTWFSWRKCPN